MPNYVRDEKNNMVEGLSKEETYALLDETIKAGKLPQALVDSGFVSKLKCVETGQTIGQAYVTQAQYNELAKAGTLKSNTLYTITDDPTLDDLSEAIETAKAEAIDEANSYTTRTVTDRADSLTNYHKNYLQAETMTVSELGDRISKNTGFWERIWKVEVARFKSQTVTTPHGLPCIVNKKSYLGSFSVVWINASGSTIEFNKLESEDVVLVYYFNGFDVNVTNTLSD